MSILDEPGLISEEVDTSQPPAQPKREPLVYDLKTMLGKEVIDLNVSDEVQQLTAKVMKDLIDGKVPLAIRLAVLVRILSIETALMREPNSFLTDMVVALAQATANFIAAKQGMAKGNG